MSAAYANKVGDRVHLKDHGVGTIASFPVNPEPGTLWIDRQGDVWSVDGEGVAHTPETAPMSFARVVKKFGPLRPLMIVPDVTVGLRQPPPRVGGQHAVPHEASRVRKGLAPVEGSAQRQDAPMPLSGTLV